MRDDRQGEEMTSGEKWWNDLLARLQRDPGYWSQAIIIDLQILWRDIKLLFRSVLTKEKK